jgi:hypothetical protein
VVRDLLLGRVPADLDIVTAAPLEVVAGLFARTVPVGAEFGVTAVVIGGRSYEVAQFRSEGPYRDGRRPSYVGPAGLEDDIRRRDFTINALVYDPLTDTVIDHVGGQADLAARVIRTVGDAAARFAEDHLRMLRAVRLTAELRFTLDAAAEDAMRTLAPRIRAVSAERVHEELVRLLVAPGRDDAVRLLARTGLLAVLLPEVAALSGRDVAVAGGRVTDALTLTIQALGRLRRPSAVVAIATALLLIDTPGVPEAICRRLRFSAAERRAIVALVRDHHRVPDLPLLRTGALRGLFGRMAPADLLEVYRVRAEVEGRSRDPYIRAAEVVAAHAGGRGIPGPLLTGDDLVKLGFEPGPGFAQVLDAVDAARARGEIATPAEAAAWVRARFAAGASVRVAEASPGLESPRDDGG